MSDFTHFYSTTQHITGTSHSTCWLKGGQRWFTHYNKCNFQNDCAVW